MFFIVILFLVMLMSPCGEAKVTAWHMHNTGVRRSRLWRGLL
jgi:hypothetical protein